MKFRSPLALASCVFAGCAFPAGAAVLSAWDFETNTPADSTNSTTSPSVVAESGVFTTGFTTVGVHTSAATDWSTPAGNGSANSFSVNTWAVSDYFQFASASTGYAGITVSFDQTGSNTGPRDFKLQYSTDGSTFTDFSTYSLPGPVSVGWNATTAVVPASTSFAFDLSGLTVLDNDASIFFRIMNTTTTSINAGTVATGGTGRIDNLVVATIPEPASAVLGAFGLLALLRRRRR